ncbi:DUF3037 domain-containing protein [Vibrio salinus]|uniref:DUF3037 domain-containing protein n=1 Tax=Vibrio salinus TaxID=2899784 RepID=UPI001E3F904E|nr:DUF3037 domain-containing protein [Vibrio salinus]MCE0495745.1 DUF3037 domain-containing protein [Vibrio salinus]
MKAFVEYAVVRFMPFSETQEFANVGVVIWNSEKREVLTKLAPTPFSRINNFFDDLDGNLYKTARHFMDLELRRIQEYARDADPTNLDTIMNELTRQREGVMTFSESGMMLTEQPQKALEDLYSTFIGRDLKVPKEIRERVMVRELKNSFRKLPFEYKEHSLATNFGQFNVPLATEVDTKLRAIKPMAFNQNKPIEIADHGDKWVSRVRHALDAQTIEPSNFLFTIEKPKSKLDEALKAFESVEKGMKALGVNIIPYDRKSEILRFATPDIDSRDFELR